MKFAIVDIETTGSKPGHGRVTEIAIYLHDGHRVIDSFCSLINPECLIPPFISRLTGISNEMVENAPRFYEVAKNIVEITREAVFVAHNVGFDYHFIRHEFKSLGFNFVRDFLCTLQVSRKILSGMPSYSLGNLCRELNITIENRHRAHGDALATVKLFEILYQKVTKEEIQNDYIKNEFLNLRFPPDFNRTVLDILPENAGVYYFHDATGNVIYIGKSKNIRKRILSHFSNNKNKSSLNMLNAIADVTFEETGNELIALLLESEEIKRQRPLFNKKQKRTTQNHGIYLKKENTTYFQLIIDKHNQTDEHLCTLNSFEDAQKLIENLIVKFNLCSKYCSPFDTAHSCFRRSIKECLGACLGIEDPELYNARIREAAQYLSFAEKNFFIIGKGRTESEKSAVQVEKGKYKGYGYFENDTYYNDINSIKEVIKSKNDNRDINQIIQRFLRNSKTDSLIRY